MLLRDACDGQVRLGETKFIEDFQDSNRIFTVDGNPDIQIPSSARMTMIPYRVSPNQEVLNAVDIQQSQKLFEVGR